jgi:hypothetical protein
MPANTPTWQLPYPLPTDPVAAGAADIRALAEALDARLERFHNLTRMSILYALGIPANAAGLNPVPWTVSFDELAAFDGGLPNRVWPNSAMGERYIVTAYTSFTGASGDGGVQAQLVEYDGATGAKIGTQADGYGPMNGAVTLATLWPRGAHNYIQLEVHGWATGAGHTLNWALIGIQAVNLAPGTGPALLPALPEPIPYPPELEAEPK